MNVNNPPSPIPVMNVASQSEAQAVALLLILVPDRLAASSASVALSDRLKFLAAKT